MSGHGLSPRDRQQLAILEELSGKFQHAHGLVERYAAERTNVDPWLQTIQRTFTQLKHQLAGLGFDAMSQQCAALALAARRGSSQYTKTRILREGIGSLRLQLDVEQRSIRSQASGGISDAGSGDATPPPPSTP